MSSYSEIYLHIIWVTKHREMLIKPDVEVTIIDIVKAKCQKYDIELLAFGNIEDHLHLLVKSQSSIRISDVISEIKGATSFFVNKRQESFLKWQDGYACLSIGRTELKRIQNYVKNQKEHHQTGQGLVLELERMDNSQSVD